MRKCNCSHRFRQWQGKGYKTRPLSSQAIVRTHSASSRGPVLWTAGGTRSIAHLVHIFSGCQAISDLAIESISFFFFNFIPGTPQCIHLRLASLTQYCASVLLLLSCGLFFCFPLWCSGVQRQLVLLLINICMVSRLGLLWSML